MNTKEELTEIIGNVVVNDKGNRIRDVFHPEFVEKIVDALIEAKGNKSKGEWMLGEKQIEVIIDLLTEFDEMGFAPTTTVPNPEAYAVKWRDELTKALMDYRKQEWISVEDALPEVGEDVLLYSKEDDKIDIGHYSNMFCRFFLRKFEDGNVTHWMPLPDAPKGE